MKLLFDESLPHPIRNTFEEKLPEEFTIRFVQEEGWDSYDNGELLTLAQNQFDAFVTADTNIANQSNLNQYEIGTVIIHGTTNRLEDLNPLVPDAISAIKIIEDHECKLVSHSEEEIKDI